MLRHQDDLFRSPAHREPDLGFTALSRRNSNRASGPPRFVMTRLILEYPTGQA